MSACARLLLGYRVPWLDLLEECQSVDPDGEWYSDALRLIRLSGACRAPGMQPVGAESWYIPAAEEARLRMRPDTRGIPHRWSEPTKEGEKP